MKTWRNHKSCQNSIKIATLIIYLTISAYASASSPLAKDKSQQISLLDQLVQAISSILNVDNNTGLTLMFVGDGSDTTGYPDGRVGDGSDTTGYPDGRVGDGSDTTGYPDGRVGDGSDTTGYPDGEDPVGAGSDTTGYPDGNGENSVGDGSDTTGYPDGNGKKQVLSIYHQVPDTQDNLYMIANYPHASRDDLVHQVVTRINALGEVDYVYHVGLTDAQTRLHAFMADDALFLAGVVSSSSSRHDEKLISILRFDERSDTPVWQEKVGGSDQNTILDLYLEDDRIYLEARFIQRTRLSEAFYSESDKTWLLGWSYDGELSEAHAK